MLIFRNDDVNPNTNILKLTRMYDDIINEFPDCRIISGVTLFSRRGSKGSVYDLIPFKDMGLDWLYKVDSVFSQVSRIPGEIASHGLFHVDHSKLSKDAQEMSILPSCNFLKTKKFIPPFNRFNNDTREICFKNNIEILSGPEWKSFEFQKFEEDHRFWYFHSWRFTQEELRKVLNVSSRDLGQLQTNINVSA